METALAPFVTTYCLDCHSGDAAEASLHLDKLLEAPDAAHHRIQWRRVVERLQKGEMPPEEAVQPEDEERAAALEWLAAELAGPDCSRPQDPGRSTLRRLNRTEYRNTIRDLTAVDFDTTAVFPPDELGYGFDNNGDVLSLPAVLLEKYLQAGEEISARAIVTPESIIEPADAYTWGELRGGDSAGKGSRALLTNGRIWAEVNFDAPGEYLLRVKAFATQAGDEPTKMRIFAGDEELRIADVEATAGDPEIYVARFTAAPGRLPLGVDLLNDAWEPWAKDPDRRDRNLFVVSMTLVGPTSALMPEKLPESHRLLLTWTPTADEWASSDAWTAPTRDVLSRLLLRAYRRPPKDKELDRLVALAAQSRARGDSYERAMQLALQAALVSPQLLMRGQWNDDGAAGGRPLDEFELASRLSYFLWSSMPDDELLALAAEGRLRENLDAQLDRMIASSRSAEFVRNFGEQWLEIRRLETMQRNAQRFPQFDDELRAAFREETYRLLDDVMRNNRPLATLLSADYSFVNARLAKHYGMPEPEGEGFVRVELPAERRAGVLAHGSVLTVTAFEDRTSPVLRGKWVLDHLLNDPQAPPPPGVTNVPEATGDLAGKTFRERLEVHRANPSCAVCHNRMDPIGFALENFDAVGRWREADGEDKIDAHGQLPDGRELDGPASLRDVLLTDFARVRRCLAERVLIYALGRGLEPSDDCAINEILAVTEAGGDTLAGMLRGVVKSAPFQLRGDSPGAE
jgi:hypothetical protein